MLISKLIQMIYNLLKNMLVFGLPELPQAVVDCFNLAKTHIIGGLSVLRAFLGAGTFSYLAVLLQLIIAMNSAYIIYSIAFWVIRKIPFFSIKE